VDTPDWTARVKAVETLLNQGFGRPSDENKKNGLRPLDELGVTPIHDYTMEEVEAGLVVEYLADPELLQARKEFQAILAEAESSDAIHKLYELAQKSDLWQWGDETREAEFREWQEKSRGENMKAMPA
jgi:hypothetical protein